jgi:autotransporter passenger strand-loop-strand repeat protein
VVLSGGVLNVSAGGTVANFTVASGGSANLLGTSLSGTNILSGGVEVISSGGVVTAGTSSGTGNGVGGTVYVLSGGVLDNAVVFSSGALNISAGGTARNFAVSSGGLANVAGTTTSNVSILRGGIENVSSGGVVTGTSSTGNIDLGTLNVSAGGAASFVSISSGGVENDSGLATFTTVSSGGSETIRSGGTDDGAQISGGIQAVFGTASGATIFTGSEVVESGGIASATTISNGVMELAVGGAAGGAITFAGTSGTLQIDGTTMPGNTISGFVPGDMFYLSGVAFDSSGSAEPACRQQARAAALRWTAGCTGSRHVARSGAARFLTPRRTRRAARNSGRDLPAERSDSASQIRARSKTFRDCHRLRNSQTMRLQQ